MLSAWSQHFISALCHEILVLNVRQRWRSAPTSKKPRHWSRLLENWPQKDLQVRLDPSQELWLGEESDDPLHGLAFLEEDQRRDASYTKVLRRADIGVHIELGDLEGLTLLLGD